MATVPGRRASGPVDPSGRTGRSPRSVAVMLGLEGAVRRHPDIGGLFGGELRQLHADPVEVQARHLLVQVLGQDVDLVPVFVAAGPELDLGQNLIGEGRRHHEGRVAGGIPEVQQAPFGQQDDPVAARHLDHVHLILDVGPLVVLEVGDLDLVVEVADVADDGHVLHRAHMLDADDVAIAGGGDEDVGAVDHVLQDHYLEPVHRGLQRADRVDLGHLHAGTGPGQGRGAALAHVAVAAHDRDLAGHHRVGGPPDAVDQRLLAAVLVVELGLGDAVVHVDRGERQAPLLDQLVQAVDSGGRLFAHALDGVALAGEPAGRLRDPATDLREEKFLLLRRRDGDQLVLARLDPRAHQDVHRGVAAVVEDQVAGAAGPVGVGEVEDAVGIVPVLLQRLALDGEDGGAARRDGRRGMVLGREDVARGPAHVGAKRHQRLDQDGGLDRHVKRSRDARAPERLRLAQFRSQCHEARHLGLGDVQLLAAVVGQTDVPDDVVLCGVEGHWRVSWRRRRLRRA